MCLNTIISFHLANNKIINPLSCEADGDTWIINGAWGQVLSVFMIMMIIMQSVSAERVFFSIPHQMNYFSEHEGAVG